MKKGIAHGGPRAGIMLTAPETWDGRVRYPDASNRSTVDAYYPGHYRWLAGRGWIWRNTPPVRHL